MHLVASVRPSVRPFVGLCVCHYKSLAFVCVSVISSADAVDRLLIVEGVTPYFYSLRLGSLFP